MNAAEEAAMKRFMHKSAKVIVFLPILFAKEICAPHFAVALVVYPCLIASLLAARLAAFSLVIPTPTTTSSPPSSRGRLRGKYDLWETGDHGAITRTAFAFAAVGVVHLVIVFHLLLRGVPGSWYIKKKFALVGPVVLWFSTTSFYFTYVSLARYHTHPAEWGAAATFSAILFLVTAATAAFPCRSTDYLEIEDDPRPAQA